jgi:hypothetical protein
MGCRFKVGRELGRGRPARELDGGMAVPSESPPTGSRRRDLFAESRALGEAKFHRENNKNSKKYVKFFQHLT